jgi:hypothetical protein
MYRETLSHYRRAEASFGKYLFDLSEFSPES